MPNVSLDKSVSAASGIFKVAIMEYRSRLLLSQNSFGVAKVDTKAMEFRIQLCDGCCDSLWFCFVSTR